MGSNPAMAIFFISLLAFDVLFFSLRHPPPRVSSLPARQRVQRPVGYSFTVARHPLPRINSLPARQGVQRVQNCRKFCDCTQTPVAPSSTPCRTGKEFSANQRRVKIHPFTWIPANRDQLLAGPAKSSETLVLTFTLVRHPPPPINSLPARQGVQICLYRL
jgi:hypothetical protein